MSTGPGRVSSVKYRKRKQALYVHQQGTCFWCTQDILVEDATMDELVPRSRGGTQRWGNIVVSCRSCNETRADNPAPPWAIARAEQRGKPESAYA